MSTTTTLWSVGNEILSDATGAVYHLLEASGVAGFWLARVVQPGDTEHSIGEAVAVFTNRGPYTLLPPLTAPPSGSTPDLVVVACGGAKRSSPLPAAELYAGLYFGSCLRYARTLVSDDRIRILSARWGLVCLCDLLAPYNTRLGQAGAVDAQVIRRQAEDSHLLGAGAVTVLGGRDYVALAREVWPEAKAPLEGVGGIGKQLQWLRARGGARRCEVTTKRLKFTWRPWSELRLGRKGTGIAGGIRVEAGYRPRHGATGTDDDPRWWGSLALYNVPGVVTAAKGHASWQAARAWVERTAAELVERHKGGDE